MKFFTNKSIVQKFIIAIVAIILFNFTVPIKANADWSIAGTLLKEIMQLVASIGDIGMGLLNDIMLGADGMGSAMLSIGDDNLSRTESWLYMSNAEEDSAYDVIFQDGDIDTRSVFKIDDAFEIPNMLYSPENIFANNIAALDVNFLSPNTFEAVADTDEATEKAKSSANYLSETIASWYKSFRNIAVVGLLSVLIYLGIRMLISSTASDKARYKESLMDWFIALCLVFVIHFIMSGILMLTDNINNLFATQINEGITVKAYSDNKPVAFRTNIIGLIRFQAQSSEWEDATGYTIMYFVLVIYTFMFTFMYFKRFLYTAFFTMIAPLVALTYPIDKAGDGKSQAFNMWFKEYTMNVIIQPIHLILYTVFVTSAYELAADNPLYAIVAIGFLIPAEKFIKRMFGLDRAESADSFGSFAGGAVVMSGINKLASIGKGGSSGGSGNLTAGAESKKGKTFIPDSAKRALAGFVGGNPAGGGRKPKSRRRRRPETKTQY